VGKGKCRGSLPVGEKGRNLGCLRAPGFATVRASMRRLPSLLAAALLALACASPAPPPAPPEPARPFDTERAWEDLEALAAIGSRPSGSQGAARARHHLRAQLEGLDLEVHTWSPSSGPEPGAGEAGPPAQDTSPAGDGDSASSDAPGAPPREASVEEALGGGEVPEAGDEPPSDGVGKGPESEITHLVGVIPGELDPVVVLAARYDSARDAGPAANAAASGPALVLELARAIAADPLPYTTCVVFLDGGPDGREGVRLWARALREQEMLDRVRLALVFHRVADGEAPIVRDLFSRRPYRQVFWETAERWGAGEAFPGHVDFAPVDTAHTALLEAGLRRVVALAGTAPAPPPPTPAAPGASGTGDAAGGDTAATETEKDESAGDDAGAAAGAEAGEDAGATSDAASTGEVPGDTGAVPVAPPEDTVDRASRQRLGAVGLVALEGLDVLTRRLAKVERLLAPPEPVEARATPAAGIGPDLDPALP